MNVRAKKWIKFTLRWGIAIGGIAWVVANISLRDRVMVVDASDNRPVSVPLAEQDSEDSSTYLIEDPATGEVRRVGYEQVVTKPDRAHVTARLNGVEQKVKLLAIQAPLRVEKGYEAQRLLVEDPKTLRGAWIDPPDVVGGFKVTVPYPRVEPGISSMIHHADPMKLWAAVLIFPVTFFVTSLRWHALLKALDIVMTLRQAFVLNMVGAFYNTFMPGSTGGDLLKAYYASKHTIHRTRAVLSVLIDRVIGLLALVLIGGGMAAYQWEIPACRRVAIVSALLMAGVIVGLFIFYTPLLRRIFGLDFIIKRLPMQKQVQSAIITMDIYRRRPVLILWAIIITMPVHITVILSAAFAGNAFGLPLSFLYYWVVVPVVVLVGSMPISPQGAGVMEFFAITLTRNQGATIAEAFALTMSIRLVQMFWNLFGGIFVFKGSYRVPSDSEQATIDQDEEERSGFRVQSSGNINPDPHESTASSFPNPEPRTLNPEP